MYMLGYCLASGDAVGPVMFLYMGCMYHVYAVWLLPGDTGQCSTVSVSGTSCVLDAERSQHISDPGLDSAVPAPDLGTTVLYLHLTWAPRCTSA